MIAFLTSRSDTPEHDRLIETNGFAERLRARWKFGSRCLFVCSDPDNRARTDAYAAGTERALTGAGLTLGGLDIWDSRRDYSADEVGRYDVLFLSGGHVPTQNAFFRRVGLREKLAGFDGIVIGVSAGTMNSAETVYAHPELEGESIDPDYRRFLPGLGLTKAMVLPHYQAIRDETLDGKRVMEDIAYLDSMGRVFYALVDGSYLLVENGRTALYGEAYRIANGVLETASAESECVFL